MALFNVHIQLDTIMVVKADDVEKAIEVAQNHWMNAVACNDTKPDMYVTDEVLSTLDLRDGWVEDCIPYGGDGNTRIKDMLNITQSDENLPNKDFALNLFRGNLRLSGYSVREDGSIGRNNSNT